MRTKNSIKWGMVTMSGCITCATLAHYVPEPACFLVVLIFAVMFSVFGTIAVSEEQGES